MTEENPLGEENNIIVSGDDMPEKEPLKRKKYVFATIAFLLVVIIVLIAYYSFIDKRINKGIWGILDFTPNNDDDVGELEDVFSYIQGGFLMKQDVSHVDKDAGGYLKQYFGLADDSRFPEDMPETNRLSIVGYGYCKIQPVEANMFLNNITGTSHSVMEAYCSHQEINGDEMFLLFYRETEGVGNPQDCWKILPLTEEARRDYFTAEMLSK